MLLPHHRSGLYSGSRVSPWYMLSTHSAGEKLFRRLSRVRFIKYSYTIFSRRDLVVTPVR